MEPFAGLFLCLLTAHLISDFLLQNDQDVRDKGSPRVLAKHVFLTALLAYLVPASPFLVLPAILVGVSHGLVDLVKLGLTKLMPQRPLLLFLGDQAKHIAILAVVAWFFRGGFQEQSFWSSIDQTTPFAVFIVVSGLIACTRASGFLIGIAVQPYRDQIERQDAAATEFAPGAEKPQVPGRGLEGGGEMIGLLERLLIFTFVLSGLPEAVGFLITAKSIFRFGELKDRENLMGAEYILIGTFLSFALAFLLASLTRWALLQLVIGQGSLSGPWL